MSDKSCLSLIPDHCEASGSARCAHHGDVLSHHKQIQWRQGLWTEILETVLHGFCQASDDGDKAQTHTCPGYTGQHTYWVICNRAARQTVKDIDLSVFFSGQGGKESNTGSISVKRIKHSAWPRVSALLWHVTITVGLSSKSKRWKESLEQEVQTSPSTSSSGLRGPVAYIRPFLFVTKAASHLETFFLSVIYVPPTGILESTGWLYVHSSAVNKPGRHRTVVWVPGLRGQRGAC